MLDWLRVWPSPCPLVVWYMGMDIPRKDAKRKKAIRLAVVLTSLALAIVGIAYGVSRLKIAAPPVEMSALWPDTVKRGPLVREVRGIGTLVPEDTMLITATTDARVERILIRPGTPVRPDSLVMILSSPELDNQLLTAEYAVKVAEADYAKLEVTLQASLLDMQSKITLVNSDHNTAVLQADRDAKLAQNGLVSEIDAKISSARAEQLQEQLAIEKKRVEISAKSDEASLAAARVKVD